MPKVLFDERVNIKHILKNDKSGENFLTKSQKKFDN